MSNRHVPLIWGIACLGLAAYLFLRVRGTWTYLVGPVLIMFGVGSLRTAFSATDKEIRELTTEEPVSPDTERKLRDRF